jgi:nicotinamidase/pyrazinamidase
MNITVVVDYQYDFLDSMHGGALAVPGGWEIEESIKRYAEKADFVIGTRDWHPFDHNSFSGDDSWPPHCVKGSSGAVIVSSVDCLLDAIVSKGEGDSDGYSAWENWMFSSFFLNQVDPRRDKIVVCGLATDYCVKETAMDIVKYSKCEFVTVPSSATRGVDEKTTVDAIHEMEAANVIYDRFA